MQKRWSSLEWLKFEREECPFQKLLEMTISQQNLELFFSEWNDFEELLITNKRGTHNLLHEATTYKNAVDTDTCMASQLDIVYEAGHPATGWCNSGHF